MLRKVLAAICLVLLLGLAFLGWQVWTLLYGRPAKVDTMAARQFVQYLAADPETLTSFGFIDGSPFDLHSDDLSQRGQARLEMRSAIVRKFRKELDRYDRAKLSADQALTFDVWSWWLDTEIAVSEAPWAEPVSAGPYVVDQFGLQEAFVRLMTLGHEPANAKLAKNYVARLRKFGSAADQTISAFEAHAAEGVMAPRSILERTLESIDLFLDPAPKDSVLVTSFRERLEKTQKFSPKAIDGYVSQAEAAVAEVVYPGMQRLKAAIEAKLPEARTEKPGLIGIPGGAQHYRARLRQHTSADTDPEALHQLGLAEAERLATELTRRLEALGYTDGTLPERMERLRADTRLNLANDEAGRQEILRRANVLMNEAATSARDYFNRVPKAPVEIRLEPAHTAQTGAPSSYSPPAADGSRPGIFSLSVRDVSTMTSLALPRVVHHEAIPGHHYQVALQQESDLPLLRQYLPFGAYREGWAIYAEGLALEMGLYKGDPLAEVGLLASELSGAVILALDTGLHHKGWSSEEGIAFMERFISATENYSLETAVDRSLAWPAQLLSYGAGYQKIKALRARAEERLGDRFDVKSFHDEVLRDGAVPLAILERKIDAWIAAQDRGGQGSS